MRLSPTQGETLDKLSVTEWRSAHKIRASMATLDALVRKGLVERRGWEKLGADFAPRTTIEYRRRGSNR